MNKKIILCIIGESGVGKSTIASIFKEYGFYEVQSHTDRPKRFEGEDGHIFHTKESFDEILDSDKIATTVYGGYRYCTNHNDINHPCVFIVDENGFKELKNYSDLYNIISLRVYRDNINIDENRAKRNLDNYKMKDNEFNYIFYNNYNNVKEMKKNLSLFIELRIMKDIELLEHGL